MNEEVNIGDIVQFNRTADAYYMYLGTHVNMGPTGDIMDHACWNLKTSKCEFFVGRPSVVRARIEDANG